jgi:hypothetical protein
MIKMVKLANSKSKSQKFVYKMKMSIFSSAAENLIKTAAGAEYPRKKSAQQKMYPLMTISKIPFFIS